MEKIIELMCIGSFLLCVGISLIIGVRAVVKYFFPGGTYNPRL